MPEERNPQKIVDDFNEWKRISASNGWKAYKIELERQIKIYTDMMDNDEAGGELLKNYQLIKKGLKIALNIPNMFEVRVKNSIPKGGM